MDNKKLPFWQDIHTIVFDFDGIFTNNKVIVDQEGNESVICDRGDGLAFDILRRFIVKNNWDLEYFILSKEENNVVSKRAGKLKIKCYHNINDKYEFLIDKLSDRFNSESQIMEGLIYLGNDLNDLKSMLLAEFSVSPADAHPIICKIADVVFKERGGNGFVRAFIENLLQLDKLDMNELMELA